MSGLCAVVTVDGSPVDRGVITDMAAAAPHRFPNGPEVWSDPGATLGSAGVPPSWDDDMVVAIDARIDNRDELLAELGVAYPVTDVDLVRLAIRRWDEDAYARLLGDFVVILWERRTRRLVVARDAMGVRNVYYRAEARRRTLVATEVKQLLGAPDVPCRPDEVALTADLAGLYAHPDMTAYEGIKQLPPGHLLEARPEGVRLRRYWFPDPSRRVRHRTADGYAEELRVLLAKAISARFGEEPVGVLLSGGLDSTAVVASVGQRRASANVRAYTWAFDELRDGDERAVARPVAAHAGVPLTSVAGDDAWPLRSLREFGPDRDDPYTWLYQQLFERTLVAARADGRRVICTADRGDELIGNWVHDDLGLLLAGRWRTWWHDQRAYRDRMGTSMRRFVIDRLAKPLATTLWPPGRVERLRGPLQHKLGDARLGLPPWIPDAHARKVGLEDVVAAATAPPSIRGHARLQRHTSVFDPSSLRLAELRQRSSARYGMEHVDPWADRRVVEFALAAPQWRLQGHSRPKDLTRLALRGALPEPLRQAAGQTVPLGLFRRAFNDREVDTVRRLLADSRAAEHGWLDSTALLETYEAYLQGRDLAHDFWHPLCVELWLRAWWE